ncbi:hypothetical protein [Actinoplanes sp. NPDC049118]|uniref:hypothetical protein n=1 Tax=Actinoplanes sp. NPDC049118 TaxID=3155769 RepID=UPI0033EEFC91
MTPIKTLLVGAAVGVLLAVAGVAVTMRALDLSAEEVATAVVGGTEPGADPLAPPEFYGSR